MAVQVSSLQAAFVHAHGRYAKGPESLLSRLGALDFELKLVSCLMAAAIDGAGAPADYPRTTGLGTVIGYLRRPGPLPPDLARLAGELADAVTATIPGAPTNLKTLRDLVFHGTPTPDDGGRVLAGVVGIEQAIHSKVTGYLSSPELLAQFSTGRAKVALDALLITVPPHGLGVLSGFSAGSAKYLLPRHPHGRISIRDEAVVTGVAALVAPQAQRDVSSLADWIRDDLRGFANPDVQPLFNELYDGSISFGWVRQVAGGDETRSDRFRLGPDEQREWSSPAGWVPYSRFLRELAFWGVTAQRLRQDMIKQGLDADVAHFQEARVALRHLDFTPLDPLAPEGTASSLLDHADEAVRTNRGRTLVLFLAGEAGIGKTQQLATAALRRAAAIEETPSDTRPLYVYVSASGNLLVRLDQAIGAAAATTRNLTDDAIVALARNGLVILLIDGFDELLGGTAYTDAVGSLRPLLERLGGRGVLVVSARSTYFLQQYQQSLSKVNATTDLLVRHEVAELQPWNDGELASYLRERGVAVGALQRVPGTQRTLLRVPFYAKEFVDALPGVPQGPIDLRSMILDRFLNREVTKLRVDGQPNLLSRDELHSTMIHLAELMSAEEERAVDLDSLELAVDVATSGALATRKGLRERIRVLCGLEFAASGHKFTFGHELYFDTFLGEALALYLKAPNSDAALTSIIAQRPLRKATVETVADQARDELVSYLSRTAKAADAAGRSNHGAFWSALFARGVRVPTVLSEIDFAELDLSRPNISMPPVVEVERCRFTEAAFALTGTTRVIIRESQFEALTLRGTPKGSPSVTADDDAAERIAALRTDSEFADSPKSIRNVLVASGVCPAGRQPPNPEVEAYRFILNRMVSRGDIQIVVLRVTHLPDDKRLNWLTSHYGEETWLAFVRRLQDNRLAVFESFSASDQPKEWLRFLMPPAEILEGAASTDARVAAFWDL